MARTESPWVMAILFSDSFSQICGLTGWKDPFRVEETPDLGYYGLHETGNRQYEDCP